MTMTKQELIKWVEEHPGLEWYNRPDDKLNTIIRYDKKRINSYTIPLVFENVEEVGYEVQEVALEHRWIKIR